ncbi:MAG: ribose transport system substrate-binding protein [Mycobacteriales bacterium]|jgi:ribose transport system substrate-binding protein
MAATRRTAPATAVAALGCAALVACGSSGGATSGSASGGGSSVTIDVGTQKLTFPAGTKPKIAMFAGSGIAYQTAYHDEIPNLEQKYGISITYFDSKFDPTTQLNQLRSAIQTKKFNAFMVENYSAASACTLLTKQAPAAGIVVSQLDNPTCDQATKPAGDEFWTPGTLNSIGAESTVTYYTGWAGKAKQLLGAGNHQVAVINGPPLVAATKNMDSAMSANGITPVANLNSDYTTPTALKETAALLQSHPDVDAIFSVGPDVTVGIVSALKQAGKSAGQVKVFEVGGAKQNAPLIESGYLTMSVPYTPTTIIDTAVEQLVNAFAGKQGPRFDAALNVGTADSPFQITKDTVGSYQFEY